MLRRRRRRRRRPVPPRGRAEQDAVAVGGAQWPPTSWRQACRGGGRRGEEDGAGGRGGAGGRDEARQWVGRRRYVGAANRSFQETTSDSVSVILGTVKRYFSLRLTSVLSAIF